MPVSAHHFRRRGVCDDVQPACGLPALTGRQPHAALRDGCGRALQYRAGYSLRGGVPLGRRGRRCRDGCVAGRELRDLSGRFAAYSRHPPLPRRSAPAAGDDEAPDGAGRAHRVSKPDYLHWRAGAAARGERFRLRLHGWIQCRYAADRPARAGGQFAWQRRRHVCGAEPRRAAARSRAAGAAALGADRRNHGVYRGRARFAFCASAAAALC